MTPLDDATRDTTLTFFGFYSPVFRARHAGDGQLYALRTLRAFRPANLAASAALTNAVERWKRVHHPAVVTLREAFLVDGSEASDFHLWFLYDYHPASRTLEGLFSCVVGSSFL